MGFECGINLRNKETKKETGLFFLGNLPDTMDSKIINISKAMGNDTKYLIDYNKVEHFVDFLKTFHMLYIMYSDRVLDELETYLCTNENKPSEVSKDELAIIKDAVYMCDCDNLWKINNFYNVFIAISNIDEELYKEFDLIYWRSY